MSEKKLEVVAYGFFAFDGKVSKEQWEKISKYMTKRHNLPVTGYTGWVTEHPDKVAKILNCSVYECNRQIKGYWDTTGRHHKF